MNVKTILTGAATVVVLALPIAAWASSQTGPADETTPCGADAGWMQDHWDEMRSEMQEHWDEMNRYMDSNGFDHGPGMMGGAGMMGGGWGS